MSYPAEISDNTEAGYGNVVALERELTRNKARYFCERAYHQEGARKIDMMQNEIQTVGWELPTYQRCRSCFDVIQAVSGFALIFSTSTSMRTAAQPVV